MVYKLRSIALTVDEARPGLFHWALIESHADRAVYDSQLDTADEPYDSYEKAAKAGLLRWIRVAGEDARRGPRVRVDDEALKLSPSSPSLQRG